MCVFRMWRSPWSRSVRSHFSCRSGLRSATSSLQLWGWRGGSKRTWCTRPERRGLSSGSSTSRGPSTSPAPVTDAAGRLTLNHVTSFYMIWYTSAAELKATITRNDTGFYLPVSSAGIFDPYVPPEGDARLSSLSKEGLKQRTEQIRQSAASQLA